MNMTAYLYDGLRSPFGRHAGALAAVRPDDLLAGVVAALVARNPFACLNAQRHQPCCKTNDLLLHADAQPLEDHGHGGHERGPQFAEGRPWADTQQTADAGQR